MNVYSILIFALTAAAQLQQPNDKNSEPNTKSNGQQHTTSLTTFPLLPNVNITPSRTDTLQKPTPPAVISSNTFPDNNRENRKPCANGGSSMCNGNDKHSFFKCSGRFWQQMTCSKNNECRMVRNQAVCMDPKDPTPLPPNENDNDNDNEPQISCPRLDATMCDGKEKSSFFMCNDHKWMKMKCDGNNVCLFRGGKTSCVSQAVANTPIQPCTVNKSTRCVLDNRHAFQICIDNYWSSSTCSNNNYCLYRNGQALCVDKATAEAPVLPCKKANSTRCVDDDDTVYQICYQNYWTNSACDKGNVCGMKKGNAVCHDSSIPLIDVPEEPCPENNATQCVAGNDTLYQICYQHLWSNNTCDGSNVCRMIDDKAACVDKNSHDGNTYELNEPQAFVPSKADTLIYSQTVFSWTFITFFCALSVEFGTGLIIFC